MMNHDEFMIFFGERHFEKYFHMVNIYLNNQQLIKQQLHENK